MAKTANAIEDERVPGPERVRRQALVLYGERFGRRSTLSTDACLASRSAVRKRFHLNSLAVERLRIDLRGQVLHWHGRNLINEVPNGDRDA